ncbi:MAG TPA: UDP-3-O-(3-hydroxymyristoyl)glucosamine N-acyltransferase [Desulfatiglandales bacterium]|nr:UDP-3-O-(3-hydroxymyristoyl)glucosamine N-acyltransferase [Desulfatiglandales bacterium]
MELTLKHIAKSIGGTVVGDDRISITGINSLLEAKKGEMSFLARPQLRDQAMITRASALIVKEETGLYRGPQVIVSDPYLAYAKVATLFEPAIPRFPGVSERAVIEEGTRLGDNVSIYPLAYIGKESVLGKNVIVFPGVYLGDRVTVGDETIIYPNVTIMSDCAIGKHCIIHAGTVIGSDGFGFVKDGDTNVKIPQTGIVEIEDNVEIGANNTIDRAALGKTLIRKGVKTDNLVQIGHNVVVDENTIIVAQVGISGSTKIGKGVVIGGQVGLVDHIEVGDRVMIGSKSGVAQSIPAGEVVSGIPTMPHRHWLRTTGHIRRFPEYAERIKELEKKVKKLEEQLKRE